MSRAPERSRLSFVDLQRWFLERVVAPHRTGDGSGAAAPPATGPAVAEVILPSATLDPEQRLGIYSEMYFARLCEVMAGEHPVLERLMGADAFVNMLRDYLGRHPSRSFTLNDLACALPRYLKEHCARDDAALLLDIVRLERAISDAYDTPHFGTLTAEALAAIPAESWSEIRFRMDPSVRIMAFDHDACAIVNAHLAGEELPELSPRPSWAMVWRHDNLVWRQPITRTMHAILSALARGDSVTAALEGAYSTWEDDDAELEARVFQWFSEWLNEGLFRDYVLSTRA